MVRSTEITAVANAVLDEMIADLILSTAISAHREIKRGRVVCGTCGTRCRAHLPLPPPILLSSSSAPPSRTSSPQPSTNNNASLNSNINESIPNRANGYSTGPERGTGGATGIGSGSGRVDGGGNVFFECLVCARSIASNRYAPHLSSCLGFNGSTRRGAARSAAARTRLGNNDRSSPSPYVGNGAGAGTGSATRGEGSENGDWNSDGDSVQGSKKRKMINGSAKRGGSPGKPPLGKKAKLGSASGSATPTPTFARQALPPSKLGRPPTNRPAPSSPQSINSSPEKSIPPLSQDRGSTGRKTLPGMSAGPGLGAGTDADPLSVPDGDDSSEGADDDY